MANTDSMNEMIDRMFSAVIQNMKDEHDKIVNCTVIIPQTSNLNLALSTHPRLDSSITRIIFVIFLN